MEGTNPNRRVKVYVLGNNSVWVDKGTGYVSLFQGEGFIGMGLEVVSETDKSVILESKVVSNDTYHMQQDTLIVWSEPETDTDYALSFQNKAGCQQIWDKIQEVQKNSTEGSDHGLSTSSYSNFLDMNNSIDEGDMEDLELPPANLSNLENIAQLLSSCLSSPYRRERLTLQVMKENYISKLSELFHVCEDLEDKQNLHLMFAIFKGLIMLNDTIMLESLMAEDTFMTVFGALEYDPELSQQLQHRNFLQRQVIFKEVVPFHSPELVTKIHVTFRLQYLKDVGLARSLDDPTFTTINSLIFLNQVDIVTAIQNDDDFLTRLFERLRDSSLEAKEEKDLILFLQELCNLAKNLQLPNRVDFYRTLGSHQFLAVLSDPLLRRRDCPILRLSIVSIIEAAVTHDASIVRDFALSEKPHHTFVNAMLQALLTDSEMGVRVQLTDILRLLLDQSSMDQAPERDEFLTLFYDGCIQQLVSRLGQSTETDPEVDQSVLESVCGLLAFCVTHHGYRSKYFLLGHNVTAAVLRLLSHSDTSVVLAAVRFLRAVVGVKDEFYNRHVVKQNLFEPLIEAFKRNGPKYNLLNSAILELFEFIRTENAKGLIAHLVENFGEWFKTVTYVDTFKLLMLRHEQNEEVPQTSTASEAENGALEQVENEAYFNKSDDEEDHVPPPPPPLEDFKPLPTPKEEEDDVSPVFKGRSDSQPPSPSLDKKRKAEDNGKSKISIQLKTNTLSADGETEAKKQKT